MLYCTTRQSFFFIESGSKQTGITHSDLTQVFSCLFLMAVSKDICKIGREYSHRRK